MLLLFDYQWKPEHSNVDHQVCKKYAVDNDCGFLPVLGKLKPAVLIRVVFVKAEHYDEQIKAAQDPVVDWIAKAFGPF